MKKVLKIAGGIFLFIIVLSVIIGPSNEPSQEKEVETDKAKQEEVAEKQEMVIEEVENEEEAETQTNQDVFTKEDALQRIQSHKTTKELHTPTIAVGTTIKEVYETRGKTDFIENLGWVTEETDTSEVYEIGYNELVNERLDSNPRWEVSKDEIKTLNGIASGITPEFKQ